MNQTAEAINVCTIADVGLEITGADAPSLIEAINAYLSFFAKPVVGGSDGGFLFGKQKCLKCGKTLGGLLGSFQWGLASGEGTCRGCGWPCRIHHCPKDADGNIFVQPLMVILQYHPRHVTNQRGEADAT